MVDAEAWKDALLRAREHAPFLNRSLDRFPELAALLARGEGEAALDEAHTLGQHPDPGIALRRERTALALSLAIGDLAGAFDLQRVVRELTRFADRALDTAIRTAIEDRTGNDEPAGFIALALGKQGAGELNYSSDIDPVLLYDPARLTRRENDEAGEAAQRYARRIVKLLSENTIEGHVLRVDLRLRPASEISPLAVPLPLALEHYQSAALPWERAAYTRARAAAGDCAAGEAFLEQIKPFIWRHDLDFGAREEIRALTARIRDQGDGPRHAAPGFDIKRGRGGIREIEFVVQAHQLIHGGRDPLLRVRGTREALAALVGAERMAAEDADALGASYDRLRMIEHRLQMVSDRQTHALPEGEWLESVARLDGMGDGARLVEEVRTLTESAAAIYERLIGAPDRSAPLPSPAPPSRSAPRRLDALGFEDAPALAERIAKWGDGRYQTLRTPQARAALDALTPALLDAFAKSDDPVRAMARWETMLERAPSALKLFRLLNAEPALLTRLARALSLAPTLSDELARRPELLDTLMDRDALEVPGTLEDIKRRITRAAERDDYEALLDAIRLVTGEMRFALGIQLIEGLTDPLAIGAALSRVAEAALSLAVQGARAEFAKVYGHIDGSELLVLGLGRLGGGALTHASDLDIVYLFTGEFSARSDGERSLSATHYFNRLASRVSAALSVPTAQGALYEVDTRLRPQGAQGPLAVSCDAFARYQREAAWTWEHMALARARVLIGSHEGKVQLEAIMRDVLRRERDRDVVRAEVRDMRAQMAHHKQPNGPLDIKRARGGLIDCEFLVHYLQLQGRTQQGQPLADEHGAAYSPDLGRAIGNLHRAGFLPAGFLQDYDMMTRMLVAGRLLAPTNAEPPIHAAKALAKACHATDYDALLRQLDEARQRVRAVWSEILGQTIDDTSSKERNR